MDVLSTNRSRQGRTSRREWHADKSRCVWAAHRVGADYPDAAHVRCLQCFVSIEICVRISTASAGCSAAGENWTKRILESQPNCAVKEQLIGTATTFRVRYPVPDRHP